MANIVGKLVFKKILKETAANKFGKQDGLFEQTPATRMNHKNIKFTSNKKKLRKALPPGLSSTDQEVLVKVKRRAYMLDMSLFSLCGLRFGWSSVIGLIPACVPYIIPPRHLSPLFGPFKMPKLILTPSTQYW